METPKTIRAFWFGAQTDELAVIKECSHRWWSKQDAVDREIRQRFEPVMRLAKEGTLNHWTGDAQGLLALILLTDRSRETLIATRRRHSPSIPWRVPGAGKACKAARTWTCGRPSGFSFTCRSSIPNPCRIRSKPSRCTRTCWPVWASANGRSSRAF